MGAQAGRRTSKGRKAIHMKMGKPMLGKQMFAGPSVTRGHREDFNQLVLAMFLPVSHTNS